jgi:adenylate cyclase
VEASRVSRKLAAILAADAVGYSRLVAEDEEYAIQALRSCLSVVTDCIKQHQGEVFSIAGDGVVADFASPVESVRCAIDIQRQLASAQSDCAPDRKLLFRVGIHLGDVVAEGPNRWGDGVNVAARLEQSGEPGQICISDRIHEQVKHLPELAFRDLGKRSLKNMPAPVHIYSVAASGSRAKPARRSGARRRVAVSAACVLLVVVGLGAAWKVSPEFQSWLERLYNWRGSPDLSLPQEPSIAVLPLQNVSADPSQNYFIDGLTNDITTDLAKFANLFVVANNSAASFRGKPTIVQVIGQVLGVRYVLEGTAQKSSSRVRINVQLIEATSGRHVWAERYDRAFEDLFAVQDDIVQTVVAALAVKVNAAELARVTKRETTSMQAYDLWLQGRAILNDPDRYTLEGTTEARQLFQKAIEVDPNFARAYGHLSYT